MRQIATIVVIAILQMEKIGSGKLRVLFKVTNGVNGRNGNSIHICWLPSHLYQTMNIKKQLVNVNEQFPLDPY